MLRRFFSCTTKNRSKAESNEIVAPTPVQKRSTTSTSSNTQSPYLLPSTFEMYASSSDGRGVGKSECQDTFVILPNLSPNICFLGVFDGHGPRGKAVSNFVKDGFIKNVTNNYRKLGRFNTTEAVESFIKNMFRTIDNKLIDSKIDVRDSGSCCITVFSLNKTCYIANLGDSRAIVCRELVPGHVKAINFSVDHKPTLESERNRILHSHGIIEPIYVAGKEVGPMRVWTSKRDGGLAMTRSMGDLTGKKAGIISEPDIRKFDFTNSDKFLIAASDGLWDVMSSDEAVQFVINYLARGKSRSKVPNALVKEAGKRWAKMYEDEYFEYQDDITVIVAFPVENVIVNTNINTNRQF